MTKKWLKPLALIGSALLAWNASAASFDCEAAKSTTEKLICLEPNLSQLDEQLSSRYRRVSSDKQWKKSQLAWLKARDACLDSACLITYYQHRIEELKATEPAICKKIERLYSSGEHGKYSIPFEDKGDDSWVYAFDLDKNRQTDNLEARCGNGSEAICEMRLFMNGKLAAEFGVPAGIRLIEIKKIIYIVTGVSIYADNRAEFDGFSVRQLLLNKEKLVCGTD
ncbi:lysozyme inhibitor LprI family protein [Chitinimonas arctica]|nr:lysozyme inhibitor LprI family protein [Chitinimonas arctica]